MTESSPSVNPSKIKAVNLSDSDLNDFGQANLSSAEGAEAVLQTRRVELDITAGNPSSLGTVDEPYVQPGASPGEDPGQLGGDLKVPDQPILSGGYADIFRGIWIKPDGAPMAVAVKTLKPIRPTSMSCRPELLALQQRREKRLKREVAIWTRPIHPNIHPLLGYRTQPEPSLVSPWCQNGNLMDYLGSNPELSRPEKLRLLEQTACGLAFLHSQSPPICHADIKPENVLVNDLCNAALSDFGISRVIQELDAPTGFTTEGGPNGSQNYMAPELFEEENAKPTLETDVYAFGGLTLAVMSGSPPFAQIKVPAKVLFRIVNGKHPRPDEHPELEPNDPLWSMMLRCWAHKSRIRPTSSDIELELKKQREPSQPITHIGSNPSYQMLLHNLQMQGKVYYMESAVADGPHHRATWTASVFLLNGPNGAVIGTYIAKASTRQGAREQASGQALVALNFIPAK